MQYILLFCAVVFLSSQKIISKQYNVKTEKSDSFLFSSFSVLSAFLFFLVSAFIEHGASFSFNAKILPYSLGFAVTYSAAVIGTFYAIRLGSLAVSSLISAYSLLIPTLYGVIFLRDDFSVPGIILLMISIFFINKPSKNSTVRFTAKWVLALIFCFLGNGLCSAVQKMQQVAFEGQSYTYKSEFMVVALAMSFVIIFTVWLISVKFKLPQKGVVKNCLLFGVPHGLSNGITNLLVVTLAGCMPAALLYPTISAGDIAIGFVIAVFVYKEKLSNLQYLGYALGVAAIILLNL